MTEADDKDEIAGTFAYRYMQSLCVVLYRRAGIPKAYPVLQQLYFQKRLEKSELFRHRQSTNFGYSSTLAVQHVKSSCSFAKPVPANGPHLTRSQLPLTFRCKSQTCRGEGRTFRFQAKQTWPPAANQCLYD